MALSLREIVHHRYGVFLPGGFSVKNDVLRRARYDFGGEEYGVRPYDWENLGSDVSLRSLLTALELPVPSSIQLTGFWIADNDAHYYLKQEDNGTLWWVGFSTDPDPDTNPTYRHGLQEGLSYTSVFQGQMAGRIIEGVWVDVPRGERLNTGRLTLQISSYDPPFSLNKVASSGDGFAESRWMQWPPFPAPYDIVGAFENIRKNDSTIMSDNLKPYKDSAAVFCLVKPDPDFPDDPDPNSPNHKRGVPNVPQWHLNYPPDVERSYKNFLCDVDGHQQDGDLNMHIQLLPQLYDASSTFWDHSNGWIYDATVIQNKLTHNPEGENVLHLEVIMFGRGAKNCGDIARYNESPSLPGWQELNGNSVLLNGRPINGQVVSTRDYLPDHDKEYYGETLGDPKLNYEIKSASDTSDATLLRVTGVVVLDCGHYDFPSPSPCYDDGDIGDWLLGGKANQEIHPVYAIDIVNATSSDVSGTWSDDGGRTFYLRQLDDNTLWGLGMSPFRDFSFARVFQGTIQPDQSATLHWVDVPPFFGPIAAGHNSGSMTLRTAGPGDTSLFGGTISLFVTWSDSPVEQRWTKLYDLPASA
jgi:hypothetical protein